MQRTAWRLLTSSPLFRRIVGATTRSLGEQRQRELFVLLRSRCRTSGEQGKISWPTSERDEPLPQELTKLII